MIENLLTPLISIRFLEDEHYRNGHLRVINALSDTRILGIHIPELKKLTLLTAFVPAMDNWAVCDTICCNIKWIKDKNILWEYLQPYYESDREFHVRFALVMSMIFFRFS